MFDDLIKLLLVKKDELTQCLTKVDELLASCGYVEKVETPAEEVAVVDVNALIG